MSSKNLGQVSGVYVGNMPPTNTILIWYDNTPTQLRHKIYDPALMQWVVLDQSVITSTTYSELVNSARTAGLSVGQYFVITDKYNALALVITSTKVQYSDNLGNILIDDLGINIQYHVSSSNLQIDDVTGVFDTVNKKLVFAFDEQTASLSADEYILGKSKRNNVWSLVKYKLQSFLSKVAGNSITWNGGFFFSFSEALKSTIDKSGGIVGKDAYDADKERLTTSINNVAKENQNIIQNAHDELIEATKPGVFYETKLPQSINEDEEAVNVQKGDTLMSIISKIQRWINKFKTATGIRISQDFTDKVTFQYVNNNDTVDSAIRKLQYWIKNISVGGVLPEDWEAKDKYNEIESVKANDSISDAFAKIVGVLKQIGTTISNGKIYSYNARLTAQEGVPVYNKSTTFDLYDGILSFQFESAKQHIVSKKAEISAENGVEIIDTVFGSSVNISGANGFKATLPTVQKIDLLGNESENKMCVSVVLNGKGVVPAAESNDKLTKFYAALTAICNKGGILNNYIPIYDAYFSKLKIGSCHFSTLIIRTNAQTFLDNAVTYVIIKAIDTTVNRQIFLPTNPYEGQFIVFDNYTDDSNGSVTIQGNGSLINMGRSLSKESATITTSDQIIFAFCNVGALDRVEAKWTFVKSVW